MDAIGTVLGQGGCYRDGVEQLSIVLLSGRAGDLPIAEGCRVPIRLRIGAKTLVAGLRKTARTPTAWICPNLYDDAGRKHRLPDVLRDAKIRTSMS